MTYLSNLPGGTRRPDADQVAADFRAAATATGDQAVIAAVEQAIAIERKRAAK